MPPSKRIQKVCRLHTKQSLKLFRKGIVQIPTNRRHFSISCGILEVNKENMSTVLCFISVSVSVSLST